jgi:hypothetical protein
MKVILMCVSLILITIVASFCVKKIVESILNIQILSKKENYYNTARLQNGMVYNKKTKKLEADQSIILPFH